MNGANTQLLASSDFGSLCRTDKGSVILFVSSSSLNALTEGGPRLLCHRKLNFLWCKAGTQNGFGSRATFSEVSMPPREPRLPSLHKRHQLSFPEDNCHIGHCREATSGPYEYLAPLLTDLCLSMSYPKSTGGGICLNATPVSHYPCHTCP